MTGEGPEPDDRSGGAHRGSPPLGLATAAAAAASSCVFLLGGPVVAFYAFAAAWLHATVLGLPLYLKLNQTRPLTEGASIGGGCAVGALPVLLFSIALSLFGTGSDGVDGWSANVLAAVLAAAAFGFLGMLGGAAFWAVMRRHASPPESAPLDPPL